MDHGKVCELCGQDGGEVIYRDEALRVVLANEADYPGFCRVIWNAHCKEMSDLAPAQRGRLMDAVFVVESAVRKVMQPHKINLASLGNVVPHLHWHVIPRYRDDRHFPNPIWGSAQRDASIRHTAAASDWRAQLRTMIAHSLSA
ncbi:MAG TPA: HIT family protein [Gallionellaceae bacterium]|nr:HIT family protein [Gallionellaceae bacterium]